MTSQDLTSLDFLAFSLAEIRTKTNELLSYVQINSFRFDEFYSRIDSYYLT